MSEPIIVVDSSDVRAGRLPDLKLAIHGMTEFVERNVPRALTYRVYLDRAGTRMTVVQIHPDSKSMEVHMEVSAPVFRSFVDLIQLSMIDVYGAPSDELLERLRAKTRLLGGGATMRVHEFEAGFIRLQRETAASS